VKTMDDASGMHPLENLTGAERALGLASSEVKPIDRLERVELAAAVGRVVADEVHAPEDAPGSDRSRMDGFAVASVDFQGLEPGQTRTFKVVGKALAGAPFARTLESLACVEVATGAELPMRADTVVPVELVKVDPDGSRVEFARAPSRGDHVSRQGSDYRAGDVLVGANSILTPAKIAAAAAANLIQIEVRARPRVLIVPTGDEVQPYGTPLTGGHVRESNSHALAAFVASRGGLPDRHPIVRDIKEDVAAALAKVGAYDAAVFTGGSSAGSHDFLAAAIVEVGDIIFHGVAVRPGKPILFASVSGRPVLGLPGNPTSCMVGAHLFLDRILWALQGAHAPALTATRATLSAEVADYVRASPPDFLTLILVRLDAGTATPVVKDSMSVTGASGADGYIAIAPGKSAPAAGDTVPVIPLR
jgi:molybdopterin molybdotransferase